MKKLSESAWGDMRHRSSGKVIRKEDDVNHMDFDTFAEYIKDTYSEKGDWFSVVEGPTNSSRHIEIDIITGITLSFNEVDGKIYNILVQSSNKYVDVPGLKKVFNVNVLGSSTYSVSEKDWTKSNNTFVKLIEFFLDKKTNESAWGEMRKRSSGEVVRKEDDISNLDRDGLYEYIFDLYEQINPFPTPLKSQTSQTYTYFSIPIFKSNHKVYRLDCIFDNSKISKITLMASDADVKDFKQILIDNFDCILRDDGALKITAKDGTVSNRVCMDLIKVIVENAPEPLLKKRDV